MNDWVKIVEEIDQLDEYGTPVVARICVRGGVMRYTLIHRLGVTDHHEHKYAPLFDWDGRWTTLAQAERKAVVCG